MTSEPISKDIAMEFVSKLQKGERRDSEKKKLKKIKGK